MVAFYRISYRKGALPGAVPGDTEAGRGFLSRLRVGLYCWELGHIMEGTDRWRNRLPNAR